MRSWFPRVDVLAPRPLVGNPGEKAQELAKHYQRLNPRASDRRGSTPVTGVLLTLLGPGAVRVTWDTSTRAKDYRAKWWVQGRSSPIVELGLFADRQCTI